MHRPDHPTAVGGLYVPGDPSIGQKATVVTADHMNDSHEGLARLVLGAGLTLTKLDFDQILNAVRLISGSTAVFGFKNIFLNGNLRFWQRGLSHALSAGLPLYTASRWKCNSGTAGGAATVTRQSFAAGAAPSPSIGTYYLQWIQSAGGAGPIIEQRVEYMESVEGRSVTMSWWGKVNSGTLTVTPRLNQFFGVGGSASVTVNGSAVVLTTAWQKVSTTFAVPSTTGKTIGANAYTSFGILFPNSSTFTFAMAGAMLEPGSTATEFERVDEALEYLALSRYEWKSYEVDTPPGSVTLNGVLAVGSDDAGNVIEGLQRQFPVPMRTTPAVAYFSPVTGTYNKIYRNGADADVTSTLWLSNRNTGAPVTGSVAIGDAQVQGFWDAEL